MHDEGGQLSATDDKRYRKKYRALLRRAEIECPPPDETKRANKRGRMKRSKARNLLERLIDYEQDVLRFMDTKIVQLHLNNMEQRAISIGAVLEIAAADPGTRVRLIFSYA